MQVQENGVGRGQAASTPAPPDEHTSQPIATRTHDNVGLSAVSTRRLTEPAAAQKQQAQLPPVRQPPAEPSGAEGWRERGNAAFKRGDWARARQAYSRCCTLVHAAVLLASDAAYYGLLAEALQPHCMY
jgi:hypothetical protein